MDKQRQSGKGELGVVALRQEDLSKAEVSFAQAFNGAEQCNDRASMSFWASYAGEVALAQGQVEKARRNVVQALIYARQCHSEPYMAKALVVAAAFHLASFLPTAPTTHIRRKAFRKARKALQQAFSLNGIEAETRIEAQLIAARITILEGDQAIAQTQIQVALDEALNCGVEWIIPLAKKWLSEFCTAHPA